MITAMVIAANVWNTVLRSCQNQVPNLKCPTLNNETVSFAVNRSVVKHSVLFQVFFLFALLWD